MENIIQIGSGQLSDWKGLYRAAGVAALTMVCFIPIQVAIFVIWPPPETVAGWFALFESNRLAGLLDMDLLLMVDQLLMAIIILALFVSLKQTSPSAMTIALVLGLLGVAIYFASAVAFEMLSLSSKFAAATTDAERLSFLTAGRMMLVTWQGSAFNFSYIVEAVAFLITASVMLRGNVFSKTTGWFGMAMGVLSLVPPTVPVVGYAFAFGSLIPLVVWNVLVARRLFQLART